MKTELFRVLDPGLGGSIQDRGRPGWRRFGVPPGGAMDEHAATWANRLLDNPPDAPVLELLLQSARLIALCEVWLAMTGADAGCNVPAWRSVHIETGRIVEFPQNRAGVWTYAAVPGGFFAPRALGSASACPRATLGTVLRRGDLLRAAECRAFRLPSGVAGRVVPAVERPDYNAPRPFRVWPGPQVGLFSESDRAQFFAQTWKVSAQSDRVGYRLTGAPLASRLPQVISEPVLVGSIQVPENGLPIVTMRDGPTVGGYPKLGLVGPADVSRLAQCRPGQEIRFEPAHEA